ncbi:MAG TPA: cellulase family glycosylhydrolase [Bryobacteraceae bacterium]|nr:cellulase family glycosylhydrolase [Bryobacteraceae bacterium]
MTIRLLPLAALTVCGLTAQIPGGYRGKPFLGHPQAIPGRVQAEFYDTGGEGVAYHDTEAENQGSGKLNKGDRWVDRFRRDEGVDLSYTKAGIDTTADGEAEKPGELYLGWTAPGEWVKYTIEVRESGSYLVSAHLSSRTDSAAISLAFDDAPPSQPIALPTTGHWHKWRVADRLLEVKLDPGLHVMTLAVLKEGNFNIDYLAFQLLASPSAPAGVPADAAGQVKQMGRGVNIIGYDPLWEDFTKARFQERHFQRIHQAGFQTVRVNLQAFSHMDSANQLDPVWLSTLDWVIDRATANRLWVILDEHDFNLCGANAETCRTRLKAFWQQVAERYQNAPPTVLYEILNEPNRQITPQLWNEMLRENLAIIRASNPTRTVVIGPAFWNSIATLRSLELPADDRHIIVTVHYYLPMRFTHQGAPWNQETARLSGIAWGTGAEKRKVETDFAGVQEWAEANGRPILLGEFGAYDKAGMDSRVRYNAHVARTAESLGWAWTYWQFDSDFIVYNIEKDEWVEPILRSLVPAP